jgi:ribosomal protein S18 acetylase RimI-like enzyme
MSPSDPPIVPDAPAISGLAFRHFDSPADYPAMAAIRSGSAQHDQIDPRSSREGVPSAEDHRGMFPEAEMLANPDLLLATMHDQPIGYNHVLWRWTEVTGIRVYLHLGYLLPAWRSRGIGQAMLHWAQQRIRAIAAAEQPDDRATFATNVSTTEHEADALIRHAGYTDVRRLTDMAAVISSQLTIAPLPEGVDIRPVDPAHYRLIYQAMKDAYRDMWVSTPESDEDFQEFLADNVNTGAFDPALWQIAWAGDVVAGLVITRIHQDVGHIAEVEVRRDWQRRGIARTLMQRAFNRLRDRGIEHMRLYTDAANGQGARGLYEALGFREVKQHIFYRKLLTAL